VRLRGPNLSRNFTSYPQTEVIAVCDSNPARLEAIGRSFSHLTQRGSLDELLYANRDPRRL
jgi:hypothetical protein